MIDRRKITNKHWSMKVARRDRETGVMPDTYGEVVLALDDLHQAITNLILTPKGSVPTNPEKGCDILSAIDRHPDIGIPLLTTAIWDALSMWEPRIVLEKVTVSMTAFSVFSAKVLWRPVASLMDELQVTEVAYG